MSVLKELARFLQHPEVHVVFTPSDEVFQLRNEITALREEVAALEAKATRAEVLYSQECVINLRLEDELRSAGIRLRR